MTPTFTTRQCVWRFGSWLRLVEWSKSAAASFARASSAPSFPTRQKAVFASSQESAASTARACARSTSRRMDPSAWLHNTETDFGAVNVKSHLGVRFSLPAFWTSLQPSGEKPSQSDCRSSVVTVPVSPSASAPSPHRPITSRGLLPRDGVVVGAGEARVVLVLTRRHLAD